MKKIVDYRKLLEVEKNADLQTLKSVYRTLMKTWHPDKFIDSAEAKQEAEDKSKTIIEAYHFLVSSGISEVVFNHLVTLINYKAQSYVKKYANVDLVIKTTLFDRLGNLITRFE